MNYRALALGMLVGALATTAALAWIASHTAQSNGQYCLCIGGVAEAERTEGPPLPGYYQQVERLLQ